MTDEQINIAISLQLGWRDIIIYDNPRSQDPFCRPLYGTVDGIDPKTGARYPIPDYVNCHFGHNELLHYLVYEYSGTYYGPEDCLQDAPSAYVGNLRQIIGCESDDVWAFLCSTPREISWAFLETLGLWKTNG